MQQPVTKVIGVELRTINEQGAKEESRVFPVSISIPGSGHYSPQMEVTLHTNGGDVTVTAMLPPPRFAIEL